MYAQCKWSDFLLGDYAPSGVASRLGYIALTCSGTTIICGEFRITGERLWLPENEIAYKTGARTGTSYGSVGPTCVDENVEGVWYLCQYWVSAPVGRGDSGSAVFSLASGSDVNLAGQLHAAIVDFTGLGNTYLFSPLNNIQAIHGEVVTTIHGWY